AMAEPIPPRPSSASVAPARSRPIVVCQRPTRIAWNSAGRRRAAARSSAQVSSGAAVEEPRVPQTAADDQLKIGQAGDQRAVDRGALAHGADHVAAGEPFGEALTVDDVVVV